MAESTPLREGTLAQPAHGEGRNIFGRVWDKLKLGVTRTILWSYERGTWQYDLLVLAILAFIFLTPRAWFQDRPTLQLTDLRHNQGFVEMGHGQEGWTYLVDARLVDSLAPRKTEDAIRETLRERLNKPFTLKSFEPIRDQNNVILGYRVLILF